MFKRTIIACAVIGATTTALAHTGATGIVKERMDGMKVLGKAMKTVLAETQSATPNASEIKDAARAMQDHAGDALTDLFPEGTMDHPTEAKEIIWQDWERFKFLADQLDLHARGLAMAAGNPITGKPAELRDNRMFMDFANMGPDEVFTLLGKNCKACHNEFRIKKN